MSNTLIVTRACAGGHIVADADVIGMTVSSPGAVDVWCSTHDAEYTAALHQIREEFQLQEM